MGPHWEFAKRNSHSRIAAAVRQLVNAEWRYRRSGVLGAERNAQGAVPVTLTLQQLEVNLHSFRNNDYSPSLDLTPKTGVVLPTCEVDFAWIIPQPYPEKTVVIMAECKDRGQKSAKDGDGGKFDESDIRNLKAIADAFPTDRFATFILLAKLCPFTSCDVELAKSFNEKYRRRVILLTDRIHVASITRAASLICKSSWGSQTGQARRTRKRRKI